MVTKNTNEQVETQSGWRENKGNPQKYGNKQNWWIQKERSQLLLKQRHSRWRSDTATNLARLEEDGTKKKIITDAHEHWTTLPNDNDKLQWLTEASFDLLRRSLSGGVLKLSLTAPTTFLKMHG